MVSLDVKHHVYLPSTTESGRNQEGGGEWTLTKSWTIICGSRRDQEEGGGAEPSTEPRRDQEEGGGAGLRKLDYLLLQLFLNSCVTNTVIVTLLHTAVEIPLKRSTQAASNWRGPCCPHIIVLAAVQGLLGLLRMGERGGATHSFPLRHLPPFPPRFPIPNKPPPFRGRKATCLLCPLPILLTVGNGLIQTMLIKASQ